jgi:Glycosyltransferase like family
MIAFGCSMTDPELYAVRAKSGIERTRERDSEVFAIQAAGPIFRSYNLIMEKAGAHSDLEALVLVHQDAEITDPRFCSKLREALAHPGVGVVGCVGAVGARSIAWWEGDVNGGSAVCRYGELGGGDLPAVAFGGDGVTREVRTGPVDTLDGFMMALSPWAVRSLRFDESLGYLCGYDFDFCLQVRAAGRKVVTADLEVAHHHSLDLVTKNEPWIAAHIRVAEKWEGRMPHVNEQQRERHWERRARRAEAEAAAARLRVLSTQLQRDAQEARLERQMQRLTHTASWRITEPLRRVNSWRRALVRRRAWAVHGQS